MSTSVIGIIPADDKFKKMLSIYKSCKDIKIAPPIEVLDFFHGETPDESGVKIHLSYPEHDGVKEYQNDYSSGYEIEIDKLPKNIKFVRVVNSW